MYSNNMYIHTECVAVFEKDSELLELEALVKKAKGKHQKL